MKAAKSHLILGCLATSLVFGVALGSAQTGQSAQSPQTTHSVRVPNFREASSAPKHRMTTVHEAAAHEAATAAQRSERAHSAKRARRAPAHRQPVIQLARPTAATLKQAALLALGSNPELLTAAANYEVAHQQAKQAFGTMLPQVGVNYGIADERSDNSSVNSEGLQWITLTRQQAQVNVDQVIFDGGATFNQWRSSRAASQSAWSTYSDARQILLFNVVNVYTDVLRYQQLKRVYQSTRNVYEDVLSKAKKKYDQGAGDRPEISLAESRVNQISAEMEDLAGQTQIAHSRYVQVVGVAPERLFPVAIPTGDLPKTLMQAETIGLKNSPALRAAELQVKSAQYAASAAKGAFVPRLDAIGSLSRGRNLDGVPGANNDQQIGVQVSYNLFSGGSDKAQLDAQQMRLRAAIQQYETTKRSVLQSIRAAWATYQRSRQSIPLLEQSVKQESYTVYAYNKQYFINRRSLLDLLTVQRSYLNAQIQLINERFNLITSAYQLLASMGAINTQSL